MSEDIDKCKVCVHYNGEEKGCVKYISRRNAWKEMWENDKRYCLHYTVCPLVKELRKKNE